MRPRCPARRNTPTAKNTNCDRANGARRARENGHGSREPLRAYLTGDIVEDVTLLNRLRRGHPALQTHLNTRFYPAHDINVIFYGKPSPDGSDMILVMVNLDPHGAHDCDFELPLWEFGQPDDGTLAVEDLVSGEHFHWHGKHHHIHLTPDEPYRIWRIEPAGGAHG